MSHSTVLVTGNDYEAALKPFDENTEVPVYTRYTKADLIAQQRRSIASTNERCYQSFLADKETYIKEHAKNPAHIRYLFEEFPERLEWTDEQCYAEAIKWTSPDDLDDDGGELSTYNPKSKWDWYQVGGRWSGGLITLDGESVNTCTRGELDFERTSATFAVLHDGEWVERATMGWWGITYNEQATEDEWPAKWQQIIADLPDDTTLTLVDVHI